jgi:hypothetical protein
VNAYAQAGVDYPEIPRSSGVRNPSVVQEAEQYERYVCSLLRRWGVVERNVRCNCGYADATLDIGEIQYVVEIKCFRARNNITQSQLPQLWRYMKALNYDYGLLVCPKSSFPKRVNKRVMFKNGRKVHSIQRKHNISSLTARDVQ